MAAAGAAAAPPAPVPDPAAAAFRRLYPDEFFGRVLAGTGTRPDGRLPSAARPISLALDTATPPTDGTSSPAVTALARAGRSAALAGVRLEAAPAPPTGVGGGRGGGSGGGGLAVINVEASPLCVDRGTAAGARLPARLSGLADAVRAALSPCVDTASLLVPATPTTPPVLLVARIDVLLLDADGGEVGVCLAAGAAALAASAVPGLAVGGGDGRVVRVGGSGGEAANAAAAAATAGPPGRDPARFAGLLTRLPVGVSIGLWNGGGSSGSGPPVVILDPDAAEERACLGGNGGGGVLCAVVDASAPAPGPALHTSIALGGAGPIPPSALGAAAAAARERAAGVRAVLVAALTEWHANKEGGA